MATHDARTALDVLLEESYCADTSQAVDTLLLAKLAIREYAEDYWTNDQRFEATMMVYRSLLQARRWGTKDELERARMQQTDISRQTIEWTNRPVKVELVNK